MSLSTHYIRYHEIKPHQPTIGLVKLALEARSRRRQYHGTLGSVAI
jgi:hypothetical protein